MHSILIDPRDARHMSFGTGSAGVFETNDRGASWKLLNTGMLSPAGPDPPRDSATSGCRSRCIRAIRKLRGCFRWTAPTDDVVIPAGAFVRLLHVDAGQRAAVPL